MTRAQDMRLIFTDIDGTILPYQPLLTSTLPQLVTLWYSVAPWR